MGRRQFVSRTVGAVASYNRSAVPPRGLPGRTKAKEGGADIERGSEPWWIGFQGVKTGDHCVHERCSSFFGCSSRAVVVLALPIHREFITICFDVPLESTGALWLGARRCKESEEGIVLT